MKCKLCGAVIPDVGLYMHAKDEHFMDFIDWVEKNKMSIIEWAEMVRDAVPPILEKKLTRKELEDVLWYILGSEFKEFIFEEFFNDFVAEISEEEEHESS